MSRSVLAVLLLSLALMAGACSSDDPAVSTAGTDAAGTDPARDSAATDMAGTDAAMAGYSADVTLTGDAEVPGPGAAGTADVTFTIENGEACIQGDTTDVGAVAAGHAHTGVEGESGGVLLGLEVTTEGDGTLDSCVPVDEATAQQIMDNPSGFYLNLHTADFPDGAVRGQLA